MADVSFSSDDGTAPITMTIDTSAIDLMKTPGPSKSSADVAHWILKNNHEVSLTPATTTSASSSSCSSPFVGDSTVKMLRMSNRLNVQTSEGDNPSRELKQKQIQQKPYLEVHTQSQAVWIPNPSPSRPLLDPRYAARLAPLSSPNITNSRQSSLGSASSGHKLDLLAPPSVPRNSSIFRPTSILTPPFCEESHPSYSQNSTPSSVSVSSPWFSGSPRYCRSSSDVTSGSVHWATTPRGNPVPPVKRSMEDIGVSDRFIPSRATSKLNVNLWDGISRMNSNFSSQNAKNCRDGDDRTNTSNTSNEASPTSEANTSSVSNSLNTVNGSSRLLLNTLLRTELLGENENPMSGAGGVCSSPERSSESLPLHESGNFFRYRSPRQAYQENLFEDSIGTNAIVNSFSLIPVGSASRQRLMATPPKRKRRISKVPFKVLDAPALQDDFYLNLVDWSSQNVLAVGLGSCVYLWSACTSKVTKLCDLAVSEDIVTSVSWAQRGTHLAVGTNRGEVQLWDTVKGKKIRCMGGHTARVGTLAWTGPILASGSRDRLIFLRDARMQAPYTVKLNNHKQEVCGLKWSFEEPSYLASGGNDNNLHVVDSRHPSEPLHKFTDHTAAVKAIAWSPHQHGLLASGGGTADRCIRFWNTLSGTSLNKIDTGSQVCNLAWSQNCNEIVSTHGYSLNQIVVWRYPSMTKVTTLTGHTYRVLYLAMSPDGSTIVTGAGDETLRFWQIFPGPRSDGKDNSSGLLFPNTIGSVIR